MRLSSQTFFERNLAGMSSLQQALFRVQQKLGAGTKSLTPSDDPVAAARTLGVSQSMAEATQYATSRSRAVQMLSREEGALQSATSILQDVKTLIVEAGNGTISDADRGTLATSLEGQFAELLGIANNDDGNGQYLFAGFRTDAPPFSRQADGSVVYDGDLGQRLMQVDVSRQMAAGDDGSAVFHSVQGNATHVPAAAAGNTGTGVFSAVTVRDSSNYQVSFDASGQYTVTDVTAGTSVTNTFTPGQPISLDGLNMRIDGAPAAGDVFTVTSASAAAPDVFGSMRDLVNILGSPARTPQEVARLQNALSSANVKITNAYENVLTIRSSVGSRMAELDALNASGGARQVTDRTSMSELEDLDYASAIAEFSQRQTNLQATQQTFARLQSIALFNYL